MIKIKKYSLLASLLFLLQIIDILTTYIGLSSGILAEANTQFSHFNSVGITPSDLIVKLSATLLLCIVSIYALGIAKGKERIPFYSILLILIIFYIYVVGSNILLLSSIPTQSKTVEEEVHSSSPEEATTISEGEYIKVKLKMGPIVKEYRNGTVLRPIYGRYKNKVVAVVNITVVVYYHYENETYNGYRQNEIPGEVYYIADYIPAGNEYVQGCLWDYTPFVNKNIRCQAYGWIKDE